MLTNVLMLALLFSFAAATLTGIRPDINKNAFFSLDDTTFFRGFWCVLIIFVHIPAAYQNRLQDMTGSFAYIGVTFFFMTSAYGLKYGLKHDSHYIQRSWKKRLLKILVPAVIANFCTVVANALYLKETISVLSLFNIDNWCKVLLLLYMAFWAIYSLPIYIYIYIYIRDILMCLFVLTCSLLTYFTSIKPCIAWIVEPLGFAYGIIIANHADFIREWTGRNWKIKLIAFTLLSGSLGLLYLKYKPVVFWGDYLLKIVLGMALLAFSFQAIVKLKTGNRVNHFLSKISYEIYLMQWAVFKILMTFDRQNNMNAGLFCVLSVLLTVFLAFIIKILTDQLLKLMNIRM